MKRQHSQYHIDRDQVLVFHRASHGMEKHEVLTVTGFFGPTIHAINELGEEKSVSLIQAGRSPCMSEQRLKSLLGISCC